MTSCDLDEHLGQLERQLHFRRHRPVLGENARGRSTVIARSPMSLTRVRTPGHSFEKRTSPAALGFASV